jgi:FtsZ-binding cell division protein ZapB
MTNKPDESHMIDSLKEELKGALDVKNFLQDEMEGLEAEFRKILNENTILKKRRDELIYDNENLVKENNHFNNLIESIYSVLALAGCRTLKD